MRRTYCESCARMPIAVKCTGAYPDWSAREEKPRLFALFGDVLPSRCSCALPRWELWQVLGRFGGIGRVVLSWEGENVAQVSVIVWLYAWKLWVRGKVCPPAQEFGKRGGVFRILMPTAPTRIKLSPAPLSLLPYIYRPRLFFSDVFALPVRLRPPEMGIVVVIGVFCRYWEGVLSAEGENGAHA